MGSTAPFSPTRPILSFFVSSFFLLNYTLELFNSALELFELLERSAPRHLLEERVFINNLLVRIHSIIETISVDRPRAMGVYLLETLQTVVYHSSRMTTSAELGGEKINGLRNFRTEDG